MNIHQSISKTKVPFRQDFSIVSIHYLLKIFLLANMLFSTKYGKTFNVSKIFIEEIFDNVFDFKDSTCCIKRLCS